MNQDTKKLILLVGLGNPGNEYRGNRHNVGHLFIDYMQEHFATTLPAEYKQKFSSLTSQISYQNHKLILLKPETFMNLSGDAVVKAKQFYKLDNKQIIIVHDELDLDFLTIRTKFSGGNAGHNGLKDISKKIGNDYHRIRVGIGHPRNIVGENRDVADYVLSDFSTSEQNDLTQIYQKIEMNLSSLLANEQ